MLVQVLWLKSRSLSVRLVDLGIPMQIAHGCPWQISPENSTCIQLTSRKDPPWPDRSVSYWDRKCSIATWCNRKIFLPEIAAFGWTQRQRNATWLQKSIPWHVFCSLSSASMGRCIILTSLMGACGNGPCLPKVSSQCHMFPALRYHEKGESHLTITCKPHTFNQKRSNHCFNSGLIRWMVWGLFPRPVWTCWNPAEQLQWASPFEHPSNRLPSPSLHARKIQL